MKRLLGKKKTVSERVDDLLVNESALKSSTEKHAKIFIRLDNRIDSKIKSLCLNEKISRETFIEAACAYVLSNPEILAAVINSGKERTKKRKEAGMKKRAKSIARQQLNT
jgi:hypothetical protein